MVTPSFSMPEETLQKLDAIRDELKRRGEIDMDARRSPTVRQILEAWIDQQEERLDLDEEYWVDDEGNLEMAAVAD